MRVDVSMLSLLTVGYFSETNAALKKIKNSFFGKHVFSKCLSAFPKRTRHFTAGKADRMKN